MEWITLAPKPVEGIDEFVRFWSRFYDKDPKEADKDYTNNIGKLEEKNILELFKWKFGAWGWKIHGEKTRGQIIDSPDPLPTGDDDAELIAYLSKPGGLIYRVFWLHCNEPDGFPIYDRRAHTAVVRILGLDGPAEPTPEAYVNHYRPFIKESRYTNADDLRQLDRALWAFGKFLDTYGKMLRPQM